MSVAEKSLLLAGFNVRPEIAHEASRQGRVLQVAPRTFVSTSITDADRIALLRRNSARIAAHAYPSGVLAGSAAFHRSQVGGHLLLAMPWAREALDVGGAFHIHFMRTEVDGINGEVVPVEFADDFGSGTSRRLGDDMLIIRSFQRSRVRPAQTELSPTDLVAVVERRIGQLGSAQALSSRLESLAKLHGLAVYAPAIRAYIGRFGHYEDQAAPLKSFNIFWHESLVAQLAHDGTIWHFDYAPSAPVALSVAQRKGRRSVPSFLGSILPEGGGDEKRSIGDSLDMFGKWSRFMSNITVLPSRLGSRPELVEDVLQGIVSEHMDDRGAFTGRLEGGLHAAAGDMKLITDLQTHEAMPRISGQQVKLAVCLMPDGSVLPADNGRPFTHMLKVPPPYGAYEALGSMEWFSLQVAKACRLKTEEFALVDMGDLPPALLVERFDIRRSEADGRRLMSEDFWSVFGLQYNMEKYNGELLDVATALRKHSTNFQEDARHLLLQAVFSWLTINGDQHLKNISLIKTSPGPGQPFDSIELAPMYDVLCTRVFPQKHLSAAIKLDGSHAHTLHGFRVLGHKMGISNEETDTLIQYLIASIRLHSRLIAENLPEALSRHAASASAVAEARELFDARCYLMLQELEAANALIGDHEPQPSDTYDASFDLEEVHKDPAPNVQEQPAAQQSPRGMRPR